MYPNSNLLGIDCHPGLALSLAGGKFTPMTSFAKRAFGVVLLLICGAFAGGCSTRSPKESSISWDKPADWENQVPGMESNAFTH